MQNWIKIMKLMLLMILWLVSMSSLACDTKECDELRKRLVERHTESHDTRKDSGVVQSVSYSIIDNNTAREIVFSDLLTDSPVAITIQLNQDAIRNLDYVAMVSVSHLIARQVATVDDVATSPWERLTTFPDIRAMPFDNNKKDVRINVNFNLNDVLAGLERDGLWIWAEEFNVYILDHSGKVIGYDWKIVLNDSVPFEKHLPSSEKDHGVHRAVPAGK